MSFEGADCAADGNTKSLTTRGAQKLLDDENWCRCRITRMIGMKIRKKVSSDCLELVSDIQSNYVTRKSSQVVLFRPNCTDLTGIV